MSVLAAIMKGAQPCFFETFTLPPIFNNSLTTSTWLFSAAAFRSSEHFIITITTQVQFFSNSHKTSTWPLSVAASSAVKSPFLAICTLQPLLSNCQFTSRWPLQAEALRGMLPSIPVISTLTPWFSNNKKSTWPFIDAASRGVQTLFSALHTSAMFLQLSDNSHVSFCSCCFERCPTIIICIFHFSAMF